MRSNSPGLETVILWSQDGSYYAVGIKAGDEKTVLKMTNSAIQFQLPAHGR
jgi:hypothetical protein